MVTLSISQVLDILVVVRQEAKYNEDAKKISEMLQGIIEREIESRR